MSVIKKQSHRLIKPFLLMAFSLLLITACDQPVSQRHNISLKPSVIFISWQIPQH